MKRLLHFISVAVLGPLLVTQAHAWGRDGHETVGLIAAQLIAGPPAEAHVRQILEADETLATAAEWPDCAKGYAYCNAPLTDEMKQYAADNPAHHAYHFTDVPIQRMKYTPTAAGAGPNDVVHALQDAIRVLQGQPALDPAHKFTQRTALFILAHMAGDIHQPLHVGAAYVGAGLREVDPATQQDLAKTATEGGNWFCVGSTGLHSNWDTAYVKSAMKSSAYHASTPAEFAHDLIAKASAVPKDTGPILDWPTLWATQSLQQSQRVLSKLKITGQRVQDARGGCGTPDTNAHKVAWTVTLPATYRQQATALVPEQLAKAGAHLAYLLQAIWP